MRVKQIIPWTVSALFISVVIFYPITFSSSSSASSSLNNQGEKITTVISESQMSASPQGLAILGLFTLIWMFFKPPIKPVIDGATIKNSRQVSAVTMDHGLLFISNYFFCSFAMLVVEAITTGQWQWDWQRDETSLRDGAFVVPIILISIFAYRRLLRTLSQGRPTIGQYVYDVRLISDPNEAPPSSGKLLAAYLGRFKSGEDIFKRIRLSYRPEMREQGPIVRAVSTRAP